MKSSKDNALDKQTDNQFPATPGVSSTPKQYLFTISEAAKFLGVTPDTLRNWEEKGRITPQRTPGGARRYTLSQLKPVLTSRQPNLASSLKNYSSVPQLPPTLAPIPQFKPKPYFKQELNDAERQIEMDKIRLALTPPQPIPHLAQTRILLEPDEPETLKIPIDIPYQPLPATRINLPGYLMHGVFSVSLAGLLFASLLVASYLKYPGVTSQIFKSAFEDTLAMIDPESYQQLKIEETIQPAQETVAYTITSNQNGSEGQVLAESDVAHFLEINSSTTIGGDLTTEGSALIDLNLDVNGPTTLADTLTVSGATVLEDTLEVSGVTTISDLIASGAIKITGNATDTVLIQPISDPTATTKLFTVKNAAGSEKFSVNAGGDVNFTGTGTIGGVLTVSGASTLQSVTATTLTTSGLATLASLKVSGVSTLTGAATLSSTLAVSGATTMASTLAVTGATTFDSTINTNLLTATALTFSGDSPRISSANKQITLIGGVGIGYTGSTAPAFPGLGLSVFGSIGIGTTSPSASLDVIGNANITGSLTVGTGSVLQLADGSASSPALTFTNDTDSGLWRIGSNLIALTTSGSGSSGLTINSSGNVGIGTSSSNAKLAVIGNALIGADYNAYSPPTNGLLVQGNVGFGTSAPQGVLDVNGVSFFRSSLSLTSGQMLVNDGSGSSPAYSFLNSPTSGLYSLNPNTLSLTTSGSSTSGLTITSSGNIGIGITYPSSRLAINGAAVIGSNYSSLSAPSNGLLVEGNVGIGTTATSMANFSLGGNAIIGSSYVSSQTAPSNGLLVQGNVGIGSTFTNTYTLSVGGNIGVTGHVIPTGPSLNIGSSGNRWDTGYFNTIDATTIAGVISGGSTNASDWTINADNATADTETMSLAFERGSLTPNAVFRWDVNSKLFNLNSGVLIGSTSQDSQITTSPYGIEFSSIAFDITTSSNQHLSLMPNGSGNVGIGTSGPGSLLSVNGNALIGYSGTSAAPSTGLAVQGNVGIGTTTANYNLTVVGTSNITGAATFGGQILGANGSASLPSHSFTNLTNAGLWTNGDGLLLTTGGSNTSGITVTGAGNVGIGVTNPGRKLDVNGDIALLTSGSTGSYALKLGASDGTTITSVLYLGNNGSTNDNLFLVSPTYQRSLHFQTNNGSIGTRMTLDYNGNLGIGTASPLASLYTTGNAMIGYASGGPGANMTGGLAVSGNVGIGTSSVSAKLQVQGTAGSSEIAYFVNNDFVYGSVGSGLEIQTGASSGNTYTALRAISGGAGAWNNLVLQSGGGNVGIGATTSSNKLDVWGNARITGTLTVDSTSTFGGNFTLSSGQFLAPNGTSSLPSYSFTNSTSTGLYSPSANALSLQTNGASTPPLTITAGGNVGIGITSPYTILHAAGSSATSLPLLTLENTNTTSNTTREIELDFVGRDTAGNRKTVGAITVGLDQINSNDSHIAFSTRVSNVLGEKARIDNNGSLNIGYAGAAASGLLSVNGNVGIGTTAPASALDLNGGTISMGVLGSTGQINFRTGFTISATGGSGLIATDHDGANADGLDMYGYDGLAFHTGTNNPERLRIDISGNVGIGFTSPSTLLYVGTSGTPGIAGSGDGYFQNDLEVDGVLNVAGATTFAGQILASDGTVSLPGYSFSSDTNTGIFRPSTDALGLVTGGASRMTVTAAGNVGIGTTTPRHTLEIYKAGVGVNNLSLLADATSDDYGAGIYFSTNGVVPSSIVDVVSIRQKEFTANSYGLEFATGNGTPTAKMVLLGSGNVGIGFTSPQALFTVGTSGQFQVNSTGTITTSGDLAVNGGNLTSTSSTFNLLSSNVSTLNIGDVATTLNLAGGSTSTGCTVNSSGDMTCTGSIAGSSSGTAGFWGRTGTITYLANFSDNIGIGTSAQYGTAKTFIQGAGTTTAITLQTTGSNLTQGLTVLDNGNVGIGTTGPGYSLEVTSSSSTVSMIRGIKEGSDGIISSLYFRNPSGIATIDARRETDNYGTRLDFSTGLGATYGGTDSNSNIRMTINNQGNMGIGNTNPGTMLSVSGNGVIGFGGATSITGPSNGLAVYGNVGIGTTTTSYKLDVVGSTRINGALTLTDEAGNHTLVRTGSITGNHSLIVGAGGASNQFGLYDNVGGRYAWYTNSSDVVLFPNGVNVTSGSSTFAGQILASDGTVSLPGYSFSSDTNTGIFRPSADALGFSTGGTSRMTITAAGNVGIGTTAPVSKLQISGGGTMNAPDSTTLFTVDGTGNGVVAQFNNASAANEETLLGFSYRNGGGTVPASIGYRVDSDGWTGTTKGSLVFKTRPVTTTTAATERMRINSDGNVGIGTSSAGTALDVVGIIRSSQTASLGRLDFGTDGYNSIYRFDGVTKGTAGNRLRIDAYDSITLGTSQSAGQQTARMTITSAGYIGIGTTAPASALDLNGGTISMGTLGSAGQINFRTGSTVSATGGSGLIATDHDGSNVDGLDIYGYDGLAFHTGTNNPERLRIDISGNVGIGFTSPTSIFQVNSGTSAFNINSSGIALAPKGTASAPAYSFGSLTNAGLWTNGDGLLLTTGGSATKGITVTGAGYVGIGGTNPYMKLDLKGGSTEAGGSIGLASYTGGASLNRYIGLYGSEGTFADGSGTTNIYFKTESDASSGSIGFVTHSGGVSNATRMVIDKNGNIGIGTSLPSQRFQVNTNASNPVVITSSGNVGIGFTSPGVRLAVSGGVIRIDHSTANLQLYDNDANTGNRAVTVGSTGDGFSIIGYADNFSSSAVNLISAGLGTQGGLVSIGAAFTATGSKLNVSGNLSVGSGYATTAAPTNGAIIQGNVGIGFTSPSASLHVLNTAAQNSFRVDDEANDASPFVIVADGNVGIGNPSPGASLHLGSTSINSSTGLMNFSSCNSTCGGNRTWQIGTSNDLSGINQFSFRIQDTGATSAGLWMPYGSNNVGIGTSAPYTKTHISSSVSNIGPLSTSTVAQLKISNPVNVTGNYSLINFSFPDNDINALIGARLTSSGSGGADLVFAARSGGSILGEAMTLTGAGNLGIGTTGPTVLFQTDVNGANGTVPGAFFRDSSTTTKGGLYFYPTGDGAGGYLTLGGKTVTASSNVIPATMTSDNTLRYQGALGWWGNTTNANSRFFFMSAPNGTAQTATELVSILASGNVGIGFTSPTSIFQVNSGTSAFNINSSGIALAPKGTASAPAYSFGSLTNAGLWTNGDGLLLTTGGSNTKGITVTGAGYVGIGTTAPAHSFEVGSEASRIFGAGSTPMASFWGTSATAASSGSMFVIVSTDAAAADEGGSIGFGGVYSGNSAIDYATVGGRNQNGAGATAGYLQFSTRVGSGNMTEAARIDSRQSLNIGYAGRSATGLLSVAGNVGIGTSAPLNTLDIYTAGTGTSIFRIMADATANDYGGGIYFGTGGKGSPTNVATIRQKEFIDNEYGLEFAGYSGSLGARMVMTGAGNVGIGTSIPNGQLHVAGNTIVLGAGELATPTNTTIRGAAAAGSNIAGANMTFDASNGTGSGGSGALVFRTAPGTPIIYDTATSQIETANPQTWTHTVAAGSNRLLIVTTSTWGVSAPAANTITYGGQSLTLLDTSTRSTGDAKVQIWYLKEAGIAAASNTTISVTMNSASDAVFGATSYSNIDQTTTFGTQATAEGSSTTPSATVTSATGELVIDALVTEQSAGAPSAGTNQTSRYSDVDANARGASSTEAGATSVTMSWTISTQQWAIIAVPIKAYGASSSNTFANRMAILSNGNVGIGTTTPSAPFEVKGTGTGATIAKFTDVNTTGCTLATGGTISCSSDFNLKKNISDLSYGLDDLMKLRPVFYNWKSETDDTSKSLGFIAQEVETIIPKLVSTDSDGFKQLNTIGMVPLLTKSIQELNEKVSKFSFDTEGNLVLPKLTVESLVATEIFQTETPVNPSGATSSQADLWAKIASLEDKVATLEAKTRTIVLDSLEATSSAEATPSADLALFNPLATASATLTDLNILNNLSSLSLQVSEVLRVLGDTFLGNTIVAGDLTVGGTLSFSTSSINSIDRLYLQNNSLTGAIDIFNSKVVIDPDGTITTLAQVRSAEVKTNKLTITNQPVATSSAVLAATIGEGILPSGDTTVTILTKGITAKSKVFITAKSLTSQTLSVINLIDGASFEVATTLPSTTDTYFDWWIVESE